VLARIVGEKLRGGYASTVIVGEPRRCSGRHRRRRGEERRCRMAARSSSSPDFLMTVYPHSFRKLSYDLYASDSRPVAIVARGPAWHWSAGPGLPAEINKIQDYVAWAKTNPKNAFLRHGLRPGGTPHFVGVMLARDSGVALSPVHYKGGAPALAGPARRPDPAQRQPVGEVMPYVKSGKLRVLATTGRQRSKFLPDVPTLVESGFPQIVVEPWLGFFAPGEDARRHSEQAVGSDRRSGQGAGRRRASRNSQRTGRHRAGAFAATLKADLERWQPIVKASGFMAED